MATTLDLTKVAIKVIEAFIICNVVAFSEARLDLHPPGYPLHPGGGSPHPGFSPMAAAQFMMSHPAAQVSTSCFSSPLVVLLSVSSVSGDSFSNSLKFRPICQVMLFVTIRVYQHRSCDNNHFPF